MQEEKPSTAYSAAEALRYAEEHPLEPPHTDEEELEPAATPEPDEEEETDSGEEEEDAEGTAEPSEQDEETDEESEAEDEDEVPQLDPLIEELAKGNPKAEKRVAEIAQGLQKLKTQTKELSSELEKAKPKVQYLDSMEAALSNKDTAGPALQRLIENVTAHHKVNAAELLPSLIASRAEEAQLLPERDEFGRVREEWERRGYASQKEMELENELRATRQLIEDVRKGQEQLLKEREDSRKSAEQKSFVDEIAPKTILKLSKLENGWKVTRAMVEKAIQEFPQLRDDPARAVKAAFPDELKQHYARLSSDKRKARGPEMPADAGGKGMQTPPPGRFSAADALRMIEG